MTPPVRTPRQRTQDTLNQLEDQVDAWIATASEDGPYLVPLSFHWDGATLLVSTPAASPTGRNLRTSGKVRLGIGPTRDLVLIEGAVIETTAAGDIPADVGDAFAAATGFDPRDQREDYRYFRIRPLLLQAWREANELEDRTLMRDGQWLAP